MSSVVKNPFPNLSNNKKPLRIIGETMIIKVQHHHPVNHIP